MNKWQEEWKSLIFSITDDKAPDIRRDFLEEGLEDEGKAKILTKFIKENNIDCRNCYQDHERYLDYVKLDDKIIEIDPGEPLD